MNRDKIIFLTGLVGASLIWFFSGLLYYLSNVGSTNDNVINTQSVIVETPIPTPYAINDYKDSRIEVLNATKTKGLAKSYADRLTSMGYTSVVSGNYDGTADTNMLYAPSDLKADLEKIEFLDYKYFKSEEIKIIIIK